MNNPETSGWNEETILRLLEEDPSDPEVQARLARLKADPEAAALARSLTVVELGLTKDPFEEAEAALRDELASSQAPALDPAQEKALMDIAARRAPKAAKPSWFKGLFSGGQAPSRRDLGGGPSPQLTILITMAALIFVIVGFKRLFQDAPPPNSAAQVSRMKGGPEAGLVLSLKAQGADGTTRGIPLRAKGKGTWEATVPVDASIQLMVEGPETTKPGEAWVATGDLEWRFPGGNSVPILGPEGLSVQGEGPSWSGPVSKPISLSALEARGFGEGHRLILSLNLDGESQRLAILPGAREVP